MKLKRQMHGITRNRQSEKNEENFGRDKRRLRMSVIGERRAKERVSEGEEIERKKPNRYKFD